MRIKKRRIEKQIGKNLLKQERSRSHSSSNKKEINDNENSNSKRQKLDPFNHNGVTQASIVDTKVMSMAKMFESLIGVTKVAMEKINDQD